jgi:hypothetical protein
MQRSSVGDWTTTYTYKAADTIQSLLLSSTLWITEKILHHTFVRIPIRTSSPSSTLTPSDFQARLQKHHVRRSDSHQHGRTSLERRKDTRARTYRKGQEAGGFRCRGQVCGQGLQGESTAISEMDAMYYGTVELKRDLLSLVIGTSCPS